MHMLKRILALTICVFCLLPVMARANESVLVISEDQALLEVPADIGTVEFIGDIEIENLVINGNVNLYIHDNLYVHAMKQLSGETRIILGEIGMCHIYQSLDIYPLKGDISIKYLDSEGNVKSPRFDNVEGYYIEYGGYEEVHNLIISRDRVDFDRLVDDSLCNRENTERNVISGLIQNEGIETIVYDPDNRIYTVTLEENIDRQYLGIELLFDFDQWGNTIAYKTVDSEGNDINNSDYNFNILNNRINGSLFNEGISYLVMAFPDEDYVPFSLKIYDPYNEDDYRYINVVLRQSIIPDPVPEPEPIPTPEPTPEPAPIQPEPLPEPEPVQEEPVNVVEETTSEITVRPVVNTCAR